MVFSHSDVHGLAMWRYLKIVKPGLLLITNKKLSIYSSTRHIAKPMCMLHNSHLVYKDICFSHWEGSNLKYARQKTIFRETVHQFSVE